MKHKRGRRLRKIEKRLLNLERLAIVEHDMLRVVGPNIDTRELWDEQIADYSYYDEDDEDESWSFLGYL